MANTSGMESFLGINAVAQWSLKHAGSTSGAGHSIGANGRNGGNSARGNLDAIWQANFDAAATAYYGWALRVPSAVAGDEVMAQVMDGAVVHITIALNPDGSIKIVRGTITGTILATSAAGVIVATEFCYLEVSATINDTTGAVEVLKNGSSVVSVTGADTRNAGNASQNGFRWVHPVTSSDITDLYYNQAGYWGDGRVECLKPTAEGNSSVMVPLSGTDNALMVDDQTPDDDTTYVSSGTPGDKDTYVMENLVTTSGTVRAVQVVVRARKDDAGARSIVTVVRLSATEEDSGVVTLDTTYGYARDARATKPGGGAFTITNVNDSEVGQKVNA